MNTLISEALKHLLLEPATAHEGAEQKNDTGVIIDENSRHLLNDDFLQQIQNERSRRKLPPLILLSNRFDIYQELSQLALDIHFNDFLMTKTFANCSRIIHCISKEKAINLHLIDSISTLKHCELILLGAKNEGIKSLQTYSNKQTALDCEISKLGKQHFKLCIKANTYTPNSDSDYGEQQRFHSEPFDYYAKAGQFGWQKQDRGSQLLIESLKNYMESKPEINPKALDVLDLGAGYGFLTLHAHHLGFHHIDASDNCAAALLSLEKNFALHDIQGEVIASNCANTIKKKYDVILCNPPFHQGFDHKKSLTECFAESAAKHLKSGGIAFFVVNQFVGLEKEANKHFTKQQLLDKKDGFKILLLS